VLCDSFTFQECNVLDMVERPIFGGILLQGLLVEMQAIFASDPEELEKQDPES
jgi:hypothetical protein